MKYLGEFVSKRSFYRWTQISMILFLTACSSPKSDWLGPKDREQVVVTESAVKVDEDLTPRAEIIFVLDDSNSMSPHIRNFSNSVDQFVRAFSENNPLEYNLSVVSIYDSRTYRSEAYQQKFSGSEGFFDLGEFHPVKVSETEVLPNRYFISSSEDNIETKLKHTLKIGVHKLDGGGPEFEESFSPLAAIYNMGGYKIRPEIEKRQSGFSMGPNSFKIIFFVTDANDKSNISASQMYELLLQNSNRDKSKIMAFGAIVPSWAKNCKADPGGGSREIENFLELTKSANEDSNIVSLCEPFGEKFAKFGKSIRLRTVSQVEKLKKGIPVMNKENRDGANVCRGVNENPAKIYDRLHVCYGEREIPMEINSTDIGYRYNPITNTIRINENFQFDPAIKAKIQLHYTAADPKLVR